MRRSAWIAISLATAILIATFLIVEKGKAVNAERAKKTEDAIAALNAVLTSEQVSEYRLMDKKKSGAELTKEEAASLVFLNRDIAKMKSELTDYERDLEKYRTSIFP